MVGDTIDDRYRGVGVLLILFGLTTGCNAILGNEDPVHRDEGGAGGSSSSSSTSSSSSSSSTSSSSGGVCGGAASTALQGCGGGSAWPHWVPEKPKTYTPTAETVHDSVTGLMWQREVSPDTFTWQQAKDDCEALELGGFCDWRLPSRIELASIVDYGVYDPCINKSIFPNTPSEFFWSSSTYAGPAGQAWIVDFTDGDVKPDDTGVAYRKRCVR